MKIALLSYHFRNVTAEGIVAGRVATALADAGHQVTVFAAAVNSNATGSTASQNGQAGAATAYSGRVTIERVHGDEANAPAWWQWLAKQSAGSRVWDKAAAIPSLVHASTAAEWGWVRQASRRVVEVWRAGSGFDVLHSRLNPHVSHLAALEVTRAIPSCAWSAYFSDPWPHSLYPDPYRFTVGPLSRARLETVLNQMIKRADSLVFPAERLKGYLLTGARQSATAKAFVAPHLSRPGVMTKPAQAHSQLVIRHSGFLMKERRIEPLYGALRRLAQNRPDAFNALRIEFAGRYAGNVPQPPSDLCGVIQLLPYMETEAVWDWLEDGDVLLLVEAKMQEGIFFPSKLAEYLGAGRPILTLSPRVGVAADLLSGSRSLIVEPDDEAGIEAALSTLWDEWRGGRLAELAPSYEHRRVVSPEAVVPIYEQAFAAAIERRGRVSA